MAVRVEARAEPIPGYRLIDRLGGGGFGEVWRAEAPGGLHKAIKFVYGDLSHAGDDGQRAEQELKALKRVQTVRHPYVLSLERYDIVDGQLIIVMELADRNLWDRFKECRSQGLRGIPREELLRYMEEAAEALDLMNRDYQLQHLDIKPQNVFLVHNHVKVADFGLVKDLEGSQASITGGITPVYAAPETFDGKVSRHSDQYSLAILYQELLTGQRPFNGVNVRQLIMQHLQAQPNVDPLPPGDRPHVNRALSKLPQDRFPSCRDLARALRAATVAPTGGSHSGLAASAQGVTTVPQGGIGPGPAVTPVPPSWQAVVTPPPSAPATADLRGAISETPSSQGTTKCLRAIEAPVLGGPEQTMFRAPPEVTGPGSLFPALVIGLGQMGLTVMSKLREHLHTFVAPLSQMPHLRFLLLDTDPEVMRTATRGNPGACLNAGEVHLAPLNRPSHYLKQREGRPPLESWLNPRMLYRIPRSLVTTGVRALGRLAFCDSYRSIARRLALELEAILDPDALAEAERQTGIALRTNRPRVYVLTALGGGTGSGMFIDLAYTVRALLRQIGYEDPDVVGLLLLPPVDSSRSRLLPLGNTYSALTELGYFGQPGTIFQAKYHDREMPIRDPGPPFNRCIVLPMPDESDEVGTQEQVDLCAQFLYRDLATPVGKAADLARAGLPSPTWETRGLFYQTFNLFQLTWPRHALLRAVSRKLCQRLVQRWSSKDSKPLRAAVQQWLQDQWARLELSAEKFIHRLQGEVVKALDQPVESLFQEILEPVIRAAAAPDSPSRFRLRSNEPKGMDPALVAQALGELEKLVGRPVEEKPSEEPPRLPALLRDAADALTRSWSGKLASLSVHLIEEPAYRLAGAEEAARQAVTIIEQVLQHHEPLASDLTARAVEAYSRLAAYIAPPAPGQRRPAFATTDLVDLLRAYPKWRYQSLILGHLSAAFVGLRGHLSDELREVNFCRVRLSELARILEETPPGESSGSNQGTSLREGSLGRRLFLSGCKNLREAVDLYMAGITPEHLHELDVRMEKMLRENFTALVHVCLTSANVLKDVEACMLAVARDFAAEYLPPTSAAELFFEQQPDLEAAAGEIATFHDEACPELSAGRSPRATPAVAELCVLATPADEASERFRAVLAEGMPDREIHQAPSTDDVLIYRERLNLALADLEHLGPVGHEAYIQMTSTDHFTPHTRSDIDFRGR